MAGQSIAGGWSPIISFSKPVLKLIMYPICMYARGRVLVMFIFICMRVIVSDPLTFWNISLNTFTLTYVGRLLFYLLSKPGRPRKSSEVGGGGPGPGLPTGTPDRFVLSFYLEKKLSEYQSTWICNYMPGKYLNRLQTGMIHDCCRNGRARSRGAGGVSQSQPGSR